MGRLELLVAIVHSYEHRDEEGLRNKINTILISLTPQSTTLSTNSVTLALKKGVSSSNSHLWG